MKTEWILKEVNKEIVDNLIDECEIPKPIARIFAGRNILNKEQADEFTQKPPKLIRNPLKLPDCAKAVERLKKAIENQEKIYVWGDYDVDGITSTAVIVTCFEMFGAKFVFKVPNRFEDGYDIKRHSVDVCIKENCSLLLSVDCGIVAFDTAEYAKEKGIDLIITDHHSANEDGRIPDCVAVVNPSRIDSEYGFAGLCGATVAFKLMWALALALKFDVNKVIQETLEYVALGTVADVAPMIDENRVLVHKGCEKLTKSTKPGIQALLKVAGAKEVDTTTIGFGLGPRMNAIGRLSDPMIAVELMIEKNPQRAEFYANQLDAANKRRQSKQEHMFQEAIALIEAEKLDEMPVIVCWAKSWHAGLIGLMAGKIAEKYHRPAVVLALGDNGKAKGSCRSTKTVNILKILKHPDVINWYSKKIDGSPVVGGHAFAAGMEVPEDNLISFREAVCNVIQILNPEFSAGKKVLIADTRIVPGEINDKLYDILQGLAPFGSAHPEPVFWVKGLRVLEQKLLSSDKHLKLTVCDERTTYKKISALLWFRAADYKEDYTNKKVDVLFSFGKENRTFASKFYLNIVDLRISE
jgi:single-stranded-DNA-specific exonuclease